MRGAIMSVFQDYKGEYENRSNVEYGETSPNK